VSAALLVCSALAFASAMFVLLVPVMSEQPGTFFKTRGSRTFKALSSRVSAQLPRAYNERLEKRIQMAGGPGGVTPARLVATSLLGGALTLVVALFLALLHVHWLLIALFPAAGFSLPFLWLDDRVRERHNAILRHLSFHIDLLTLSVEAGLDFTAAIGKIVERGKSGPLKEEFRLMLSEIRVGKKRSEALRAMAERVQLPQLSSFISALVQADKLGMSIGRVLRIQSETVRIERSQRAERRANEAPVKILIPLVLFIFPTIWIILAGPLVFSWLF
jgi:tight adherence protein C